MRPFRGPSSLVTFVNIAARLSLLLELLEVTRCIVYVIKRLGNANQLRLSRLTILVVSQLDFSEANCNRLYILHSVPVKLTYDVEVFPYLILARAKEGKLLVSRLRKRWLPIHRQPSDIGAPAASRKESRSVGEQAGLTSLAAASEAVLANRRRSTWWKCPQSCNYIEKSNETWNEKLVSFFLPVPHNAAVQVINVEAQPRKG